MKFKVLVVEDNVSAGEALVELLEEEFDFSAHHETSAESGLKKIENGDVDIVLADLSLPGKDGLWLLEEIKQHHSNIPVVMITGNTSVDVAVRAIKSGAYDYLSKPIDMNRLQVVLTGATRMRKLSLENERLVESNNIEDPFAQMIGKSNKLSELKGMISKVGPTPASVLILGESGTGKELVANAIVACSDRNKSPYIKLNSAALPKDTLESELFGHIKGSFTGALKDRKGKFELAHKGTLFLDEIGDMPMDTQVKILRVLQEGEIERVGGSEVIKVDVRIIAATNKDLLSLVENGSFREDLYYRLNVIQVAVPPLRERVDDIEILSESFLNNFSGSNKKLLDAGALTVLKEYAWPGNIRELRNIMERLSIICPNDVIVAEDLPRELIGNKPIAKTGVSNEFTGTMEDIEREAILASLRKTNGVKSETAKELGIGLKTLYRKLDKYTEEGIDLSFLK
jgi:two-component system, NtrC family, response regulator HydG